MNRNVEDERKIIETIERQRVLYAAEFEKWNPEMNWTPDVETRMRRVADAAYELGLKRGKHSAKP